MAVYLNKVYLNLALVSIVIIASLFYLSSVASAKTIYVDSGGGGDFTSIQDAINAANESDIIEVFSGTYNENIIINKTITLTGQGSNTVILASGTNTIIIEADNVTISGFKINNIGGSSHACIRLDFSNNCHIDDVIAQYGGNIFYLGDSNNNIFSDNTIEHGNIGIYLSNSDNNVISDNIIQNNEANGIFLSSNSNNNIIYLNEFSDHMDGNARDLSSNSWSYNDQGNYWDDYIGYDNNSDGIGDTPYYIDANSIDYYPLGLFKSIFPQAYIISISPNPAVKGERVYFDGRGTPEPEIIQWQWISSINGEIHTNSADFSTTSLSVGTHTIKFRVYNGDFWSEYAIASLVINTPTTEINQIPTATIVTIDPGSSTEGESIYFHGYGVDSDGMIAGYSWRSSRDGSLGSSSSFTLDTLSVGSHTIYFKVRDNDGDWSSEVSRQILVERNTTTVSSPIAVIECSSTGVVNSSIRFDGSKSYVPGTTNPTLSYTWDFGDVKSGTGKIITHSYPQMGDFIVTLWVEDTSSQKRSSDTFLINISNISSDPEPSETPPIIDQQTPGFIFAVMICSVSLIILFKKRRKL